MQEFFLGIDAPSPGISNGPPLMWAHESVGLVSPTDNTLVSKVLDAVMKILGTKRDNRKEPRMQSIVLICPIPSAQGCKSLCAFLRRIF